MSTSEWHGVFPIPVTPFAADGTMDLASLQRQVEFCIVSGARGIVYPGVVSEFFTLTEEERRTATRSVNETVAGRVPFIVGVAATSSPTAAAHAADAAAVGADGVMAALPYVKHFFDPDYAFIHNYYQGIADAQLPIVLQNARIGHVVSFESLRRLVDDVPSIRYLKQETSPSTHAISAALTAVEDRLAGVFAGVGGIHLINELARGACGTMPAPPMVDVIVRSYETHRSGDIELATSWLRSLAPLFTMEQLYNISLIKTVLVMRGVITSAVCRVPAPVMDEVDRLQIETSLAYAKVERWEP